jgi:hypothetical protein
LRIDFHYSLIAGFINGSINAKLFDFSFTVYIPTLISVGYLDIRQITVPVHAAAVVTEQESVPALTICPLASPRKTAVIKNAVFVVF